MSQALEKVNVSPNLGKMFSFAQKMVILFQNSVFGEIQFSQKPLTNRKKQPLPFHDKSLCNKPQYNILLLLQVPAQNGQEAAVSEKETKILRNGTRGDRGSPDHNESPIPYFSNAL